jgi:hypothetical protein
MVHADRDDGDLDLYGGGIRFNEVLLDRTSRLPHQFGSL